MQWYEIYDLAERYHTIINPSSEEKILKVGEVAGMNDQTRLIEFGCGFAAPMILWAERFGITATGIEFRPYAVRRANEAIAAKELGDRLNVIEADGAAYDTGGETYDIAVCLGASFIWGGYRETLKALTPCLRPGGRLIVGEPYWLTSQAPPEYVLREKFHTERELLAITRAEGWSFEYVLHSSHDEWDRYEADNWRSLMRWLRENPEHPDRDEVEAKLKAWQEEYLTFGREYLGWAIYLCGSV